MHGEWALGSLLRRMNRAGHNVKLRRLSRWQNRLAGWAVVAAGLGAAAASASTATNGIASYSVRAWQTDSGLPQNSVRAIEQTRDGYLWVGTEEGMVRFDGARFSPLPDDAPAELKHGWITALCAGRDGSLWVGCDGFGLARWKDGVWSRISEADGLLSNQIRCLLEGRDGSLWIGSEEGLTQYRDGKPRHFTVKNNLASNSVRDLWEDSQGHLRVATRRGLSSLDKEGTISTFNIELGMPANALTFVCEDRQGRIWTGSGGGLYCVEGERITTYGVAEGLPDKMVNVALEDRLGQLWVGTFRGVARMVEGK